MMGKKAQPTDYDLQQLLAIEKEMRKRGIPLDKRIYQAQRDPRFEFTKYRDDPEGFCRDVLRIHPWSKQVEILNAVRDFPRTSVRACHGVGKCVHYQSRLPLADGTVVEAGTLIGKRFQLLTYHADGRQEAVDAFAEENGVKAVFRVTTHLGRELNVTGNHPLLAAKRKHYRGAYRLVEPMGWVAVQDLRKGDLVAIPEQLDISGTERQQEELVKLLGYLLGDGGTTTAAITFTQQEGKARDEFCAIVQAFGCEAVECPGDANTLRVRGTPGKGGNPILAMTREWGIYGKKASEKSIPQWAWQLPNDQLALMLNRYFACDGWATAIKQGKKWLKQIGVCSASEQLIRDVELAMLRLGVCGKVRHRWATCKGKRFSAWEWAVYDKDNILRFAERVGIYGKEEAVKRVVEVARNSDTNKTQKWYRQELPTGYRWDKVVSVVPVGAHPTVGIYVPGTHTYLSTVVEHNTFITSAIALWFLYSRPNSVVLSTAPSWRQVQELLWREIRGHHARASLFGKCNTVDLQLDKKWHARGLSTNDPDKFQGFHAEDILLICDEAAGVPQSIYDAAEGVLTTVGAKQILIGNPTSVSGKFYDTHHSGRGAWKCIHISVYHSPVYTGEKVPDVVKRHLVSKEWVEGRKAEWGEDSTMFRVRCAGEFPDQADDSLIALSWIEAAAERLSHRGDGAVILGADIARHGSCETVVYIRQGGQILYFDAWRGADLMQTAGRILNAGRQYGVTTYRIDATGMGAGVADRIREQGYHTDAIFVGMKPYDSEKFVMRRDEIWWDLREALREGRIGGLTDDVTQAQLASIKLKYDSRGRIKVESKEEMMKRGIASPDRADALALAFFNDGGPAAGVIAYPSEAPETSRIINPFTGGSRSIDPWSDFRGLVNLDDTY